jgi:hypothetical protein
MHFTLNLIINLSQFSLSLTKKKNSQFSCLMIVLYIPTFNMSRSITNLSKTGEDVWFLSEFRLIDIAQSNNLTEPKPSTRLAYWSISVGLLLHMTSSGRRHSTHRKLDLIWLWPSLQRILLNSELTIIVELVTII